MECCPHISHRRRGACMYVSCWHRAEILSKCLVICPIWETSGHPHEKKHWITTIRVCPILGPLSAWLCGKLTFILKSDFILSMGGLGAVALSLLSVFVKRAIASVWLKSCWEYWRLRHSVNGMVSRISNSCIVYPHHVLNSDYVSLSPPRMSEKRWTQTPKARPSLRFGSEVMCSG